MFLSALLVACKGDETPTDPDATTWHRDVHPIVERHCTRCHDGTGVAPFDLSDYQQAADLAAIALSRIDDGAMPPPAADPECHPYVGSDWMTLPPEERDVIAAWVEDGAPEGDPASAAPVEPVQKHHLAAPDWTLRPAAGYVPEFTDGNEYRCFLLEDVPATTFVTGIEALPDNPRVSHHELLFIDPNGGSEALITDPATRSWPCASVQPEPEWLSIHAWAPGGEAIEFPAGMGLRVSGGSQVVLQMHYFQGEDDPRPDLPGYAFTTASTVDQEMYYFPLGPEGFRIPAGDARFTATDRYPLEWFSYGVISEFLVWGVMPHMHLLGKSYEFSTEAPGGGEGHCISRAKAYDFDLQPTYWFDEPVRLPADETLKISCTWDNSADNPNQVSDPPVDVTFGENTQQEMCFALMYVSASL